MSSILDRDIVYLDLKRNEYVKIECKQLDDLVLNLVVSDNSKILDLTNYKVQFNIKRPNNTYILQTENIVKNANGEVTIVCKKGTTSFHGIAECELTLKTENNKQITSFNIYIDIKQSTVDGINDSSAIIVTVLEQFENDINLANDKDILIQSDILNAENKRQELLTTITNSDTAKSQLTTTISDSTTAKNNLNTSISNASNKITEMQNKGDEILSNMTDKNDESQSIFEDVLEQNEILQQKKVEVEELLVETDKKLPIPSEVTHMLMNIMGMALFTERQVGTKYTGAYKNMVIESFMNTDNLTLINIEYDETNHKIDFGSGYVEGIAYCYE